MTDLRKIYADYVEFCAKRGHTAPPFPQWERDRKRTDAGWKLNYIG